MIELIAGLHHLKPPDGCGPIRVDRFSPFFMTPAQFGLANVRPDRSYAYVYDLGDDELANLAYYFEHDYADGRDVSTYSVALHEAVAAWENQAEQSRLVYHDDGHTLTVEDSRSGGAAPALALTGAERALCLFCDQYRAWKDIVKEGDSLGWTPAEVELFFEGLRQRRLVATADGRYVWLALRAEPARTGARVAERPPAVQMDAEELAAIREKIRAWGSALTDRERTLLGELLGEGRP